MTAQSTSHGKETISSSSNGEFIKAVDTEVDLPEKVKAAGVEKVQGRIDLPPDLKKLGVTPGASQMPVSPSAPAVTLPISDDKVFQGTSAPL